MDLESVEARAGSPLKLRAMSPLKLSSEDFLTLGMKASLPDSAATVSDDEDRGSLWEASTPQPSDDSEDTLDGNSFAQKTLPTKTPTRLTKRNKHNNNSILKSRRKTALPDEIAEVVKEAEEEESLEKYREADLAPMDPVMGNNSAGDLIMIKPRATAYVLEKLFGRDGMSAENPLGHEAGSIETEVGVTYDLEIAGHSDDVFKLRVKTDVPTERIAQFIREKGVKTGAYEQHIAQTVEKFLNNPQLFIVQYPDASREGSPTEEATESNELETMVKFLDTKSSYDYSSDSDDKLESDLESSPTGQATESSKAKPIVTFRDNTSSSSSPPVKKGQANDLIHLEGAIDPQQRDFLTIIGMVPAALFWVCAAFVANYSIKAYDTLNAALRF